MNEEENIVSKMESEVEVQNEQVAEVKQEVPPEAEEESPVETAETHTEVPVSEPQTSTQAPETQFPETSPNDSGLSDSAVKELLEAIRQGLSPFNEDTEEIETESSAETSADSGDLPDGTSTEIALYKDPEASEEIPIEAYTVVTDSDAEYRETVINRLDNILVCGIITACCAFLILFHTLKKE